MITSKEIGILKGCKEIISHYFVIREFSGSKISLYEKTIYNSLINLIESKIKND